MAKLKQKKTGYTSIFEKNESDSENNKQNSCELKACKKDCNKHLFKFECKQADNRYFSNVEVKFCNQKQNQYDFRVYETMPKLMQDYNESQVYIPLFQCQYEMETKRKNTAKLKEKHKEKIVDYHSKREMLEPKPRRQYCSVCKCEFQDYIEHISCQKHRNKLKSSNYCGLMEEISNIYNIQYNREPTKHWEKQKKGDKKELEKLKNKKQFQKQKQAIINVEEIEIKASGFNDKFQQNNKDQINKDYYQQQQQDIHKKAGQSQNQNLQNDKNTQDQLLKKENKIQKSQQKLQSKVIQQINDPNFGAVFDNKIHCLNLYENQQNGYNQISLQKQADLENYKNYQILVQQYNHIYNTQQKFYQFNNQFQNQQNLLLNNNFSNGSSDQNNDTFTQQQQQQAISQYSKSQPNQETTQLINFMQNNKNHNSPAQQYISPQLQFNLLYQQNQGQYQKQDDQKPHLDSQQQQINQLIYQYNNEQQNQQKQQQKYYQQQENIQQQIQKQQEQQQQQQQQYQQQQYFQAQQTQQQSQQQFQQQYYYLQQQYKKQQLIEEQQKQQLMNSQQISQGIHDYQQLLQNQNNIFDASGIEGNQESEFVEDQNIKSFQDQKQGILEFIDLIQNLVENDPVVKSEFEILKNAVQFSYGKEELDINPYPVFVTCPICKKAVNTVYEWDELSIKFERFFEVVFAYLCNQELFHFPMNVCVGFLQEQNPVMFYSIWNHYFNPDFLCPLLTLCKQNYQIMDLDALVEDIVRGKPKQPKVVPKQKKILKILQLSDPHTDGEYAFGNSSQCTEPTCCRKNSVAKTGPDGELKTGTAGYWGSVAYCDIPYRTFDKWVNFVKKYVGDLDFAIWTGDNTSHNIWDQSQTENLENTIYMTKKLKAQLPNVPFFPIFGNHEVYPCNLYDVYGDTHQYLRDTVADLWEDWIGKEAAENLRKEGFYNVVLKDHNLKLIFLNTQTGDGANWYLNLKPTDPNNMLKKLRDSLQESEDNNNQPVWIIQHIPVGRGTRNNWSKVYNAIVDRYSYIIRAQITGHTHADEIGVFYGQDGEINNIKFVAPSLTTYSNRKPSFRIYEVDGDTFQILNYNQYRLDIEYYNKFQDKNTNLIWEKAYDFLSEYDLENIWDLKNVEKFRQKVKNDQTTYDKYVFNHKSGVGEKKSDEIDDKYYCQMLPRTELQKKCQGKRWIPFPFDIFAGPWIEKKSKKLQQHILDYERQHLEDF